MIQANGAFPQADRAPYGGWAVPKQMVQSFGNTEGLMIYAPKELLIRTDDFKQLTTP